MLSSLYLFGLNSVVQPIVDDLSKLAPKSFVKLVAGIAKIFTLTKLIKRRLHHGKTEHFKALTKNDHSSAIADHMAIADYVNATGHNIKWDHFEILVSDKSDFTVNISFITCCLLYFTVKNFESLISFPEVRFKKKP